MDFKKLKGKERSGGYRVEKMEWRLGVRKFWKRRARRERKTGRRNRGFTVLMIFCSLGLDSFRGTPLCKF